MWLIALAHEMAAAIPPHTVIVSLLLFSALGTSLFAASRSWALFRRTVPASVLIVAGEAALWPLTKDHTRLFHFAALGIAAVSLLVVILPADRTAERYVSGGRSAVPFYLGTAMFSIAMLLLPRLGDYSGVLLTWESEVTQGFAEAFRGGVRVLPYLVQHLLWDDGLVSAGHTSLFYGIPTYALFHLVGFFPWSLRIVSVAAALASVLVIHILARRFFGRFVGAAVAMIFAVNPSVIYYGRYGTSLAGTLLAMLLAVYSSWLFLERGRWWLGALCAVSLYCATLQYAPARILVLVLLAWILILSLGRWRRLNRQRALGLVILVAASIGVWAVQKHFGAHRSFLNARGEQFFNFVRQPNSVRSLFGKELIPRGTSSQLLNPSERASLLFRVLETTVPQYLERIAPSIYTPARGNLLELDPPPLPLYPAPLAVFVAWGIARSFARPRSWQHVFLFVWLGVGSVPLLLTNRVDAHRMTLLVIPLSMCGAIGIREAALRMKEAGIPRGAMHGLAVLLALAVVVGDLDLLNYDQPPRPLIGEALAREVDNVPGAVAVAALGDHRQLAWLQLHLLERVRRNSERAGFLLSWNHVEGLRGPSPSEGEADRVLRLLQSATVLLSPAEEFRGARSWLERRGGRVSERGNHNRPILLLEGAAPAPEPRPGDR